MVSVPPPSASIIVSTLNRLPYLRKLLDALSHLEDDDFELVVVNGPSSDGTTEFLAEWPGAAKRIDCPAANLSRSRNLGLAQATGEIVVFIDDDATPEHAQWLLNYRRFFADPAHAACAAVGGEVVNAYSGRREFYRGSTSEYAEQSPQDGSVFAPPSTGWVVRGVMGCNCAMRTGALRQVGGFDENIAYYLDETDACFRLSRQGHEIGFLEGNAVQHCSAPSTLRRKWRTIFRSDTYFCIKNSVGGPVQQAGTILLLAKWKHFLYLRRHAPEPEERLLGLMGAYASILPRIFAGALHALPRLMRAGAGPPAAVVAARLGATRAGRKLESLKRGLLGTLGSYAGIAWGMWRGWSGPRRLWTAPAAPGERVRFRAVRPARKLRIGLISRTLPGAGPYGGPGQHTDALAKGLYGLGHEVHLFIRPQTAPPAGGLDLTFHCRPPSADDPGYFRRHFPSVSLRLAETADYHRAIEDLAAQGRPLDVVIGCNWDLEALALIRSGLCPVALVLVTPLAMNLALQTFPRNSDNFLWNSLDRWQVRNAALATVPSRALLDVYEDLLGLPRTDLPGLTVLPLGIERTHLPPIPAAGRRKRMLFVGRLEKRKGIQTLMAVLPSLLEEFPDWECHVVGEDGLAYDDGPPIRRRFQREHWGHPWLSRVVFHGYCSVEDVHAHYRRCDLFVAPALYESFGLAYHEAMQYGKPVVACRAGGMAETIEHGVEGLLALPDDPESLGAILRRLMSDPELRARMGAAGAERIRRRDNHEVFAHRMEAALFELLSVPATPAASGPGPSSGALDAPPCPPGPTLHPPFSADTALRSGESRASAGRPSGATAVGRRAGV